MCMGQNEVVDCLRVNWKWVPVSVFQVVGSLKEAAIHQQLFPRRLYQIFRTRYTARCTQKRKFRHGFTHPEPEVTPQPYLNLSSCASEAFQFPCFRFSDVGK